MNSSLFFIPWSVPNWVASVCRRSLACSSRAATLSSRSPWFLTPVAQHGMTEKMLWCCSVYCRPNQSPASKWPHCNGVKPAATETADLSPTTTACQWTTVLSWRRRLGSGSRSLDSGVDHPCRSYSAAAPSAARRVMASPSFRLMTSRTEVLVYTASPPSSAVLAAAAVTLAVQTAGPAAALRTVDGLLRRPCRVRARQISRDV